MSTGQSDRAIDVRSVGRRFGLRWVLRGASFEVRPGEVVGLLGPNGSGKSTLLRVVATLLKPNAGSAVVNGLDVVEDAVAVRAQVGYLAHSPGLYEDLTARENLRFAADMLGVPHALVEDSLARVGLIAAADTRVRGFSAGMQRRLALARLSLRNPRVLLLDEPYANLDEEGVGLVNGIIAGIARGGGAALVALHELAPARGLLSRTITLVDGRIDAQAERAGREQPGVASGAH
jgi:heme exporter protein A